MTETQAHFSEGVWSEYVRPDGRPTALKREGSVVRCRDCRAMRVKYGNTGIECWMNGEPFTVEPDGFCAWAKPRSK